MDNHLDFCFLIPIYNEGLILEKNVTRLKNFLKLNLKSDSWRIVLGNNASTDNSLQVCKSLSKDDHISYFTTKNKGRGHVIRHALDSFDCTYLVYMDADLATSLDNILDIVEALKSGSSIVIGSRYLSDSNSKRSNFRLFISKIYNYFIRLLFSINIKDMQCGFKGFKLKDVVPVLKKVKDNEFFFDTELLLLSKYHGLSILEIPISWNESKFSKVNFIETIYYYILKSFFLRWRLWTKK